MGNDHLWKLGFFCTPVWCLHQKGTDFETSVFLYSSPVSSSGENSCLSSSLYIFQSRSSVLIRSDLVLKLKYSWTFISYLMNFTSYSQSSGIRGEVLLKLLSFNSIVVRFAFDRNFVSLYVYFAGAKIDLPRWQQHYLHHPDTYGDRRWPYCLTHDWFSRKCCYCQGVCKEE